MAWQYFEVNFKGRIIIAGVSYTSISGPYEPHFTIWGKQSGSWEIDCQGFIDESFENQKEEFNAANIAAQAWINEQDANAG